MFTPICGQGQRVLHILFKKAWQVRREECLFTSAWPAGGKMCLSWEKSGQFRTGQRGGERVSKQGTQSAWMDQGAWGRGDNSLASEMMERRGPSQGTMRSKLLADREQGNFFTRPECTGGNLFLVLLIQHFTSSNSGYFFFCCFCLQTATVCLALVHDFAL